MTCPKCGKLHPTEHETGDYSGSAARVRYCPTPQTVARINGYYVHRKSGRTYIVIAIGRNERTLEEVVVYRTHGTMSIDHTWVRAKAEFEDGRFEEIMP